MVRVVWRVRRVGEGMGGVGDGGFVGVEVLQVGMQWMQAGVEEVTMGRVRCCWVWGLRVGRVGLVTHLVSWRGSRFVGRSRGGIE